MYDKKYFSKPQMPSVDALWKMADKQKGDYGVFSSIRMNADGSGVETIAINKANLLGKESVVHSAVVEEIDKVIDVEFASQTPFTACSSVCSVVIVSFYFEADEQRHETRQAILTAVASAQV